MDLRRSSEADIFKKNNEERGEREEREGEGRRAKAMDIPTGGEKERRRASEVDFRRGSGIDIRRGSVVEKRGNGIDLRRGSATAPPADVKHGLKLLLKKNNYSISSPFFTFCLFLLLLSASFSLILRIYRYDAERA